MFVRNGELSCLQLVQHHIHFTPFCNSFAFNINATTVRRDLLVHPLNPDSANGTKRTARLFVHILFSIFVLFICLFMSLFLSVVCLFVCLFTCLFACLSVFLFACLCFVRPSVCLE